MDGPTRTIVVFVHGVNLKISESDFKYIRERFSKFQGIILKISGSDFDKYQGIILKISGSIFLNIRG